jgi:putative endonuclease
MFVTYVLYSNKFDKIYIGYTNSLIERFHSHNNLSKKDYTINYRPWIVAYVEFFDSKAEALTREKELKSSVGRRFIREYLKNCGLISVS